MSESEKREAELPVNLPSGCLCRTCPNYSKCVSMVEKVFGREEQTELPKALTDVLKNANPIDVVCMLGGMFFGRVFSEWLKKNYRPRKRRLSR